LNITLDETLVMVNVTDVNDNEPQFKIDTTYGLVYVVRPDTLVGQQIGIVQVGARRVYTMTTRHVQAEDKDLSTTSPLRYTIVDNARDDSSKFRIDANTGALITQVKRQQCRLFRKIFE
jgi:hypothetical protein